MQVSSQQLGKAAENLAVSYLKEQGFSIIARNYRYQRAEIDIIALANQLLVFVEVKARRDNQFGYPEVFVTPRQQALIRTAAEYYIFTHDWCHALRFDIIAILQRNNHQVQLTHFEDAF
ncbi:MAG: YraN family protein [Amoebophilaceae bacterium]|jgi:putative endonuclease|nr:YraN family protein [Amoebophilaceae bacterium]